MKIKLFSLFSLIVIVALSACQSAPTPTAQNSPPTPQVVPTSAADETEANIAIVRRFYDEFSNGNADVILDVHSPTLLMHYAGESEEVPTQALRDDLAAIKAANPDLHAEIHDIFGSGDIVITDLTWTATHTGDFFSIPPTGKTVLHNGIVVRRLKDGKIVESWEAWDDLEFLHSIGYSPSWDEIVANGPPTPAAETIPTIDILLSQPNDIAGVWRGGRASQADPPETIWWFKPDGTYSASFTLEQQAQGYSVESGKFGYDGSRLYVEASTGGCSDPADPTVIHGLYTANLSLTSDSQPSRLTLKPVGDNCDSRRNALGGILAYIQPEP